MAGKGTISVNQSPQYLPCQRKAKRNYRAKNRDLLNAIRQQVICEHCGDSSSTLVFHHRDPESKEFNIGTCDRSWDRVVAEMEKCDILCRVCHAEIHGMRRD